QLRMQMAELTESQTGRTDTVEELERRTENLDSELQRIVSRLGLEDGKPAPETEDDDQVRADPAEALYNNALAAFRNREYDQARRLWQEFVSTFPDHKLVANAVFWTGESYYQLNDFGQAILSYQEVIEKHPKSNKHSAALLKQGISFMKLDKEKPGKLLLQELVNKFPDSAEAKRAKELLQN
ncbi:MAG: tol-pal system protein YbgF, partial [Desulfovibrionales bacterium]